MEGFEVISVNDDKCIGHVSGRSGDYLIVEHGKLHKAHNALPLSFAEVDGASGRVVTTLSADIVYDSPKVKHDEVDEHAVALHYGLSETVAEGYGAESDFWRGAGSPAAEENRDPERAPETGEAWET